jgi:hypothetical protein
MYHPAHREEADEQSPADRGMYRPAHREEADEQSPAGPGMYRRRARDHAVEIEPERGDAQILQIDQRPIGTSSTLHQVRPSGRTCAWLADRGGGRPPIAWSAGALPPDRGAPGEARDRPRSPRTRRTHQPVRHPVVRLPALAAIA